MLLLPHNFPLSVSLLAGCSAQRMRPGAARGFRGAPQSQVELCTHFLLQPFWPMGTGCARGFLAAFDTAWMVKNWNQGTSPLEVLAER